MATDSVANVRFNVAKTLQHIATILPNTTTQVTRIIVNDQFLALCWKHFESNFFFHSDPDSKILQLILATGPAPDSSVFLQFVIKKPAKYTVEYQVSM
jgi:hypothetical protein